MPMSRDFKVVSVTASTTQTQAGGTVLNGDFNIITCANASDAVTLPANMPVGTIMFTRNGASAGLLFPPKGGAINGGTVDASKPTDVNVIYMIVCTASGTASTYLVNKLAVLSA